MRGLKYIDKEVMELHFSKNMDEEEELELEINVSYGIDFSPEDNMCFGNAEVSITDDTGTKLELTVHAIGVFSYTKAIRTEEDQRELNDATLKEFTPHLNSLVASLCSLAEIPPMPLSYDDFVEGETEFESFTESLN